jgi:hypothetical protein
MSTNIAEEVKAVQKLYPTWSFEESWNHVRAAHPEFETISAEMNRLEAKQAPQKEKGTREKFAHIEVIARRLMQRNSKLTFCAALEITRNCLPAVQAELAETLRQAAVAAEPKPKERMLLIRGSEAEYID